MATFEAAYQTVAPRDLTRVSDRLGSYGISMIAKTLTRLLEKPPVPSAEIHVSLDGKEQDARVVSFEVKPSPSDPAPKPRTVTAIRLGKDITAAVIREGTRATVVGVGVNNGHEEVFLGSFENAEPTPFDGSLYAERITTSLTPPLEGEILPAVTTVLPHCNHLNVHGGVDPIDAARVAMNMVDTQGH